MEIQFSGMPTQDAQRFQNGDADAYGNVPERFVSDGGDLECRHCGQFIEQGDDVLLLAWSPFGARQAFAETGPVLIHAVDCAGYGQSAEAPHALVTSSTATTRLVRGYSADERIVYGTGEHLDMSSLAEQCKRLLENPEVAFLHVRSSTNNCWQARVDRSQAA